MTLYLKYRPQILEDLDLTDVRETLKRIVRSGNLPHAFLFSGPKGTGKTSAARIVAKILNCENRKPRELEPCNKCATCLAITKGESMDVFELDAASNRGIDDVRSLREAVKLVTTGSNKKVYIIDEAHMLTTEASNALLKTLEEPPSHVVFVLATTNPEKLIDTIRSRTVQVNFKKAVFEEIVRSLKRITKGEKLKTKDDVLEAVAKAARGSLRDSHKLLDQILTEGIALEREDVEKFLFKSDFARPETLMKLIRNNNTKGALLEVERVVQAGVGIDIYLEGLIEEARNSLRAKVGIGEDKYKYFSRGEIVDLIKIFEKAYVKLKGALIEQLPLEVALVEHLKDKPVDRKKEHNGDNGNKVEGLTSTSVRKELKDKTKHRKGSKKDLKIATGDVVVNEEKEDTKETGSGSNGSIPETTWLKIIASVKPQNTSTEALLRAARPVKYDGKTLTLGVYYSFHKEKLESNQHRLLLEKTVETVIGSPVNISCTMAKPPEVNKANKGSEKDELQAEAGPDTVLTEVEDDEIVEAAKEIFGN